LRGVIDDTIRAFAAVGAPPTWVLSNHDEARVVTRYGRARTDITGIASGPPPPSDLRLGTRRARAAALLMLALPGGAFVYQGEELGLADVEDLPDDARQDPMFARSGGRVQGRDGCRVPLPWSGTAQPFGFGPPGSEPWLPQPASWAALTAEAQAGDPDSMLALYREALALRRANAGFAGAQFRWLPAAAGVLHFERGDGVRCLVNLSDRSCALPAHAAVLLASVPLERGHVPADGAAWYRAGTGGVHPPGT
jgi:alpha-glucosidase